MSGVCPPKVKTWMHEYTRAEARMQNKE